MKAGKTILKYIGAFVMTLGFVMFTGESTGEGSQLLWWILWAAVMVAGFKLATYADPSLLEEDQDEEESEETINQ